MRLSDRASGLLALLLGLTVVLTARTFPDAPGQAIGPALFPSIVGVILIVLGVGLMAGASRKGESGWGAIDPWIGRAVTRRSVIGVLVTLVAWLGLIHPLGYLLASSFLLAGLMWLFGARPRLIVPVSIAVTLGTHYAFYTLLRVPLPWGVLQGIAW
jgi:putative tricarboxylic transport membrane protein